MITGDSRVYMKQKIDKILERLLCYFISITGCNAPLEITQYTKFGAYAIGWPPLF